MRCQSIGSGTLGIIAASGLASGALGCGVGAEASPVDGVAGVGAGWGTASGLGTSSSSGSGRLSHGPASFLCSPC